MKTFLAILLLLSLGLNVWLGRTVAQLENFNYGQLVGMCLDGKGRDLENVSARIEYRKCLNDTETRAGPLWHIAYALGLL
ncbi:hypothetical protein FS827_15090 [Agrobacterium vitis]|uniref:hypothetical protein n=1 Tax=Allorhizobium ampelinum TaxID=3025782 RepID=UPI001F3B4145|nr:hypothetical protein [Allorhizobium ampelinum]MCF1462636.1 hypothetical protein [Allorhizobium ampelinum]